MLRGILYYLLINTAAQAQIKILADVVVYDDTASGVIAAIAATREEARLHTWLLECLRCPDPLALDGVGHSTGKHNQAG